MKKFLVFVLLVLAFRSYLSCEERFFGEHWKERLSVEKEKKGIDISEYLEKKCEVCGQPFNYTVEVDSNSNVVNDRTTEYFGRKIHTDCYNKIISFLVSDYRARYKEYEPLITLWSFPSVLISTSTFSISISSSDFFYLEERKHKKEKLDKLKKGL